MSRMYEDDLIGQHYCIEIFCNDILENFKQIN